MNHTQDQFPRRPPRLDVFADLKPFFFVTFNTHKRRRILANQAVHESFVNFCFRAEIEHRVSVGRYVIMPDHIHLFVCLPADGLTLAQWVKALRSVLGKELLRLGIQKPHWQEGFFDHLLRSDESYSQKWDYVLMNPVRAGLCAKPDDWLYQGEIVAVQFR